MIAGSTGVLPGRQRDAMAPLLRAAAGGHPWPSEIGSGRLGHWGGRRMAVSLVEPTLVVEVSADTAVERAAGGT